MIAVSEEGVRPRAVDDGEVRPGSEKIQLIVGEVVAVRKRDAGQQFQSPEKVEGTRARGIEPALPDAGRRQHFDQLAGARRQTFELGPRLGQVHRHGRAGFNRQRNRRIQ